jgi:hypothetical protein
MLKLMTTHYRAHVIALCLLTAQTAAADDRTFSERVELAKKIEKQSATTAYFQNAMYPAIGPALASAMRECMSRAGASTVKFSLVADISQDGKFTHIAYKPNTNTAACIAAAMESFRAPPPPMCECGSSLPIVIDMSVTP